MHPVEFTWYKAIVLLTAAIALGFGILNVIYFNRIRLNQSKCTEISTGEATTALWLNIILVIFAAVLFFWSLFRLIFTGEEKQPIVNKQYNTIVHSPKAVASPITIPSVPATPVSALSTSMLTSSPIPVATSATPSYTHKSDKSPYPKIYTYRANL